MAHFSLKTFEFLSRLLDGLIKVSAFEIVERLVGAIDVRKGSCVRIFRVWRLKKAANLGRRHLRGGCPVTSRGR